VPTGESEHEIARRAGGGAAGPGRPRGAGRLDAVRPRCVGPPTAQAHPPAGARRGPERSLRGRGSCASPWRSTTPWPSPWLRQRAHPWWRSTAAWRSRLGPGATCWPRRR